MLPAGMEDKMVFDNILDAMGNTPVIRLNHIVPENAAEILVKFEGLNVGGSIKIQLLLSRQVATRV